MSPAPYRRRTEVVLRRRLAVLLAAAMMLAMAASQAWAEQGEVPGKAKGTAWGQGGGGGDTAHPDDNGKHNANGGGTLNNPHNTVC
jgi:opacity protein-like surface antigen